MVTASVAPMADTAVSPPYRIKVLLISVCMKPFVTCIKNGAVPTKQIIKTILGQGIMYFFLNLKIAFDVQKKEEAQQNETA